MKKVLLTLLIASLCVGAAGCGYVVLEDETSTQVRQAVSEGQP